MRVTDWLLPEFDAEMALTRSVLERVPLEDPEWKPHEKSAGSLPLGASMIASTRLRSRLGVRGVVLLPHLDALLVRREPSLMYLGERSSPSRTY